MSNVSGSTAVDPSAIDTSAQGGTTSPTSTDLTDTNANPIVTVYAPIEWDTFKHGVGLAVIDNQHKFLITVINRICNKRRAALDTAGGAPGATENMNMSVAVGPRHVSRRQAPLSDRKFDEKLQRPRSDKDKESIAADLDDLVTYCARYLTNEDHLLDTYNYADRAQHGQDHVLFAREVHRAHSLMESHNMEEVDAIRLVTFLRSWLVEHIPKDRRYAPLLVDKDLV